MEQDGPRTLPLEMRLDEGQRLGQGAWTMRLPVRAEEVRIERQTVVVEEVVVRPYQVQDVAHVTDTVRRETLEIESDNLEITRPL